MINLNEAFLTKKDKNNIAIEEAVLKNIDKVTSQNTSEVHSNLMIALSIEADADSKYFNKSNFQELVAKTRKKRKKTTQAEIADTIGIARQTLSNWKKERELLYKIVMSHFK